MTYDEKVEVIRRGIADFANRINVCPYDFGSIEHAVWTASWDEANKAAKVIINKFAQR